MLPCTGWVNRAQPLGGPVALLVQRPDHRAVLLGGGAAPALGFHLGGLGKVRGPHLHLGGKGVAAAGQGEGVLPHLGVVGHGQVRHPPAGGLAEPHLPQVAVQLGRLAAQNARHPQADDPALVGVLGRKLQAGGRVHRKAQVVHIAALGLCGLLPRRFVPHGNFCPIGSVGPKAELGVFLSASGKGRLPGAVGDFNLGAGAPGRQGQSRSAVVKGAQILQCQPRRKLEPPMQHPAQYGNLPVIAHIFQHLPAVGHRVLGQFVLAGAAVKEGQHAPHQHAGEHRHQQKPGQNAADAAQKCFHSFRLSHFLFSASNKGHSGPPPASQARAAHFLPPDFSTNKVSFR